MSNEIITEEQDPLADNSEDTTNSTPVVEQELPKVEPVVAPVKDTKIFDTFKNIDESNISKLDLPQSLPTLILSDEDLMKYVDLCEQQLKAAKKDPIKRATIKDIMNAFLQVSINIHGSAYETFFTKNVGSLVQYIQGEKGQIKISYPKFTIQDGAELNGTSARRYLNKITNSGNVTKIPLWHSGLILTIDTFAEQQMLDLNILLTRNQTTLGLMTRGASFTGDDINAAIPIVDFILANVIESNLIDHKRSNLNKLIAATDIPILMAGALASIYPTGYPINHACITADPEVCDHNLTSERLPSGEFKPDSLLDFTKVVWVDRDSLTNEDVLHMSSSNKSTTYEQVISYQNRLKARTQMDHNKAVIWEKDTPNGKLTITFTFKTPNLAEYNITASKWINDVQRAAELALSKQIDDDLSTRDREEKRNELLSSYAKVTDLVKHEGWIDHITIDDPDYENPILITTAEAIRESLEANVKIEGFKESLELAVQKYKENSIIAWTGISNYKCPKCGNSQTPPDSKTPSLIPLNMTGIFFSIMVSRHQTRQ